MVLPQARCCQMWYAKERHYAFEGGLSPYQSRRGNPSFARCVRPRQTLYLLYQEKDKVSHVRHRSA
jgi:hypothetical protein